MFMHSGHWRKWLDDARDWWQDHGDGILARFNARWGDDEDDDDDDGPDFGPPADGRTTLLADSVNPDSSLDPGELWAGSGNTPFNFAIVENQDEGIEIALKAKVRQSGVEVPFDASDNTYTVPSGPQDSANGSFTDNPNRAAWNFDFSINGDTDNDGQLPFGSAIRLEFDVDASQGVDYRTIADLSFDDFATSGLAAASPDGTVLDGSQNPIFGFISGLFPEDAPYDPDETGFYNIRLSYTRPEDDDEDNDEVEVIASAEITVEVIAASEFQDLFDV